MCAYMYLHVHIFMCHGACVSVWMDTCMHTLMYISMYIYIYIYIYIYTHTHIHTSIHSTSTHTHTHTHSRHIHVHANLNTCWYACTNVYQHSIYTNLHVPAYTSEGISACLLICVSICTQTAQKFAYTHDVSVQCVQSYACMYVWSDVRTSCFYMNFITMCTYWNTHTLAHTRIHMRNGGACSFFTSSTLWREEQSGNPEIQITYRVWLARNGHIHHLLPVRIDESLWEIESVSLLQAQEMLLVKVVSQVQGCKYHDGAILPLNPSRLHPVTASLRWHSA